MSIGYEHNPADSSFSVTAVIIMSMAAVITMSLSLWLQ